VLLSEHEWPSFCGERASGVERIRHRHTNEITTCVSDVRKKATLGANLLTVNFRQPSYEFTFNVGVDLLF
jgi:hypothetical protein